jgi:hypothetical protein
MKKLIRSMIDLVVSNNGNGMGEIEVREKLEAGQITREEQIVILFHANAILLENALSRVESRIDAIF